MHSIYRKKISLRCHVIAIVTSYNAKSMRHQPMLTWRLSLQLGQSWRTEIWPAMRSNCNSGCWFSRSFVIQLTELSHEVSWCQVDDVLVYLWIWSKNLWHLGYEIKIKFWRECMKMKFTCFLVIIVVSVHNFSSFQRRMTSDSIKLVSTCVEEDQRVEIFEDHLSVFWFTCENRVNLIIFLKI